MGFAEEIVEKVIKQNENGDADTVLEALLAYSVRFFFSAIDSASLHMYSPHDPWSSDDDYDMPDDDHGDVKGDTKNEGHEENECSLENTHGIDKKRLQLVEMGFPIDEITLAISRCGENSSIWEIADSIYASQTEKATADHHPTYGPSSTWEHSGEGEISCDSMDSDISRSQGKRKWFENSINEDNTTKQNASNIKEQRSYYAKKSFDDDDETVSSNFWVPTKTMVGFGLPNSPGIITSRKLPDAAIGPPYFYYENVALTPKGVWETISRFLYDIKPEFVDSQHFSAAARKRGYVHNLPIDNRFQLQPTPPLTIQEALPYTKKWWPSWDHRRKLNCIQTCTASAKLTERLLKILATSDGPPSYFDQQRVLEQCRKWNLVWVGLHKLAPLEPDEIEPLLGFRKYHTRGGGVSRTERLKALGNSFHVDTVAYHLSVLKRMFPNGINVLSLFSGIGGAEVALHRHGIQLKNVVSVENSEISRNILKNWWIETGQKGRLVEFVDVKQLTNDKLAGMVRKLGGFDLIIGGSPCNNLTGSNRTSRHGLDGTHSALFFDYFRILDAVRCIMSNKK
ncbi:unnamed protein product [Victoria cruziana]